MGTVQRNGAKSQLAEIEAVPAHLDLRSVAGLGAVAMGPPPLDRGHDDLSLDDEVVAIGRDDQCPLDTAHPQHGSRVDVDGAGHLKPHVDHAVVSPARRHHVSALEAHGGHGLEAHGPPRADRRRDGRPSRLASEIGGAEPSQRLVVHHRALEPGSGPARLKCGRQRRAPDRQLVVGRHHLDRYPVRHEHVLAV